MDPSSSGSIAASSRVCKHHGVRPIYDRHKASPGCDAHCDSPVYKHHGVRPICNQHKVSPVIEYALPVELPPSVTPSSPHPSG